MTTYIGIFKEPRGFIRLLQFIFAIFAFATACSGGSLLSITQSGSEVAKTEWSYPYNLKETPISFTNSTNPPKSLSGTNDVKPSAEFFVFTGVTSMLLSLVFAVLYVIMDRQYRNDERFPIIDLIITTIWTIFWIAGSSAWAQGVSNIRFYTSYDNVVKFVSECQSSPGCAENESGTYANIIVSAIFGFLNFFLWASSIWFVYKETRFFKSRTAQQQPQQNNFSNISAPGMYPPAPHTQIPGSMG